MSNESGIFNNRSVELEDLFVFGYACKIFRDDAKALFLDQGKHLIPWMGDESVKIDRYDARGHLSEVSTFESQNANHSLTPEEERTEQICDEERYFGLNKNYDELEMYQEEELKRLKQALCSKKEYGQVAYQYTESSSQSTNSKDQPDDNEECEEPFVASPFLDIPQGMILPSTQKENCRIEKTASTVSSHGLQMEILIKTRQASNTNLGFLHVGHPLNPYYNFVLSQMKIGRYRFESYYQKGTSNEDDYDYYPNPTSATVSSSSVVSAPSIPNITHKPGSDCVYAALVNNIKSVQQSKSHEVAEPSATHKGKLALQPLGLNPKPKSFGGKRAPEMSGLASSSRYETEAYREDSNKRAKPQGSSSRYGRKDRSSRPSYVDQTAGIRMVVVPTAFPDVCFSEEQGDCIQERLISLVVCAGDPLLQFYRRSMVNGALFLSCANERTKSWLKEVSPMLSLEDGVGGTSGVIVGDYRDLLRSTKVLLKTPKSKGLAVMDPGDILKTVERQNERVSTAGWRIVGNKREESHQTILIVVDELSAQSLKSRGWRVFLGLDKVYIRTVGGYLHEDGQGPSGKPPTQQSGLGSSH